MLFESSKLKARTSLFTESWQKRRSSFELWAFENVTPSGIGCIRIIFPQVLLITALVGPCTLLHHPTSHVLLTSPTPRRRELACEACIGTAQVGASLAAPLDSLFKRSSLRSPRDTILVFVTWRNIMNISTLKVWSPRVYSLPVVSMSVPCLFWLRYVPHESWSVCILCLFCSKYDDNTSKISQLWCVPRPGTPP